MKIHEVAARTGLSIHALRYYERAGLVAPIARADSGQRDYAEDDVYRIAFVTTLRSAGMPIAEIRRYVELAQGGDDTVAERLGLLEAHERAVERQIAELREHQRRISKKIAHYRELHQRQLAGRDGKTH
jgi:DNA-binding transcriptional MerR regulator